MSISKAAQNGSMVFVYNEENKIILTRAGDLQGFTDSTVTVERAGAVYTYDEKGALVSKEET